MADLPPSPTALPHPKLQQSMLCQAVGECVLAWAEVEHQLVGIFVQEVVRQSQNKQRWVVAHGIWSAVINFEARLRMIDNVIDANFSEKTSRRYKQLNAHWRRLHNYVQKMSSKRNEIAHGEMFNFDDKEMKIVPYATTRPFREGLSIGEIRKRTMLFLALREALRWFDFSFLALGRPSARQLGLKPLPTPRLILELRKEEQDRIRAARIRQRMKARRRPSHRKQRSHR
jgi:hypothetical protein